MPRLANSILEFCAVRECILLLLPINFQIFNFVLLLNNVFNFMLLRNIGYWRETGTPVTQIGQENDYTYSKSTILCCFGIMYFWASNRPIWCNEWANQYYFVLLSTRLNIFVMENTSFICATHGQFLKKLLLWEYMKWFNCPGVADFLTQGIWVVFPLMFVHLQMKWMLLHWWNVPLERTQKQIKNDCLYVCRAWQMPKRSSSSSNHTTLYASCFRCILEHLGIDDGTILSWSIALINSMW